MRFSLCACLAFAAFLPGCASTQPASGGVGGAARLPGGEGLRQRAERLWTARTQEDWDTVFLFEEPALREHMDKSQYRDWHVEKEPFKTHAFRLGQVQTQHDWGWVEVECSTSLRSFQKVPPRDVKRWEKWRVTVGDWYPVPRQEMEFYPEAPARRDAAEEARLSARFGAAWAARQAEDWEAFYGFIDPDERDLVALEVLTERESAFKYLSGDARWVEVIGRNGRVRVRYERKRTDPSISKLPAELADVTERWVKRGNDWYCRYTASLR